MKRKRINSIILFLLMISGINGCSDKDRNEEMPVSNQITFNNLEILHSVLPPGHYCKVLFTSQNTAYTITTNGQIFKTLDGGNTWNQQASGTEMHLYNMFFLDDLHGYIAGGNDINKGIILKTTDGGNTWTSTIFQAMLTSVYFINDKIGFAAGRKLLKTQDGGETWIEVELGYYAYGNIIFFDKNEGLMTTGKVVLKTTDGGNNWVAIDNDFGSSSIRKIQIFKDLACLFSTGTYMYITPDRGLTWNSLNPPILNSVHFFNDQQAIGVGQYWPPLGYFSNGVIYITNDGGSSWQEKHYQADEFYSIEDIDFPNDTTALAVGHTSGCVVKLRF